jgi:DNA-binding response OmpR family regulator
MTAKRILLVEDEPHLAFSLQLNLEAEGYAVVHASTGPSAIDHFDKSGPFDVVILDGMLPELDGFDVAKILRKKSERTCILMLTARAGEADRLQGFDSGVDDYVSKPFHLKELLARVKRASERAALFPKDLALDPIIRFGEFELDVNSLILQRGGQVFEVTKLEADLLKELIKNLGQVLTREHLLEAVWGVSSNAETRTVDNFIMRIRKMLEDDPSNPKILTSVRGKGYRLEANSITLP